MGLIAFIAFFALCAVGVVSGIALSLTDEDGGGMVWSWGLPLMAMAMGAAGSRKKK